MAFNQAYMARMQLQFSAYTLPITNHVQDSSNNVQQLIF